MRILFCDDDSKILAQLQKYVCEYFEKGKLKRPEMKVYVSAKNYSKQNKRQILRFWMLKCRDEAEFMLGQN